MSVEKFDELLNSMGDMLKVMTIAPHVDVKSGYSKMKRLIERNVTISLGIE
jgi:hypothetical protein